jgi:NAD(P)-dependent dehydrogenase (short-subunit alcohol dehydrogenase family)
MRHRTALVTGASRGIGLAIARALLAEGANVVITARSDEAAKAAAGQLGPHAAGFGAHAADDQAATACAAFTLERFGRLDVLVNNAGTNPAYGPLADVERDAFGKTIDVNLWAPLHWTRVVWHAAMREHGGTVVNVASMGGIGVARDLGVYNISKAALIHLTRHLALELAPGVRVNAVAPGIVRTRLSRALWEQGEPQVAAGIPLARIGEPPDVASAVVFLASDAASWITGETLAIDGGQLGAASIGNPEPALSPTPA